MEAIMGPAMVAVNGAAEDGSELGERALYLGVAGGNEMSIMTIGRHPVG